jgi:hypothetical protein
MIDGSPVLEKTGSAVWHQTLALRRADGLAEIGFAGFAEFALAAFRRVKRYYMIAYLDTRNSLSQSFDDSSAFMPENYRKFAFRVLAGQGKRIGVAYAGGNDAHEHLTAPGREEIDFLYMQRLSWSPGYCCTRFDHFHLLFILSDKDALAGQRNVSLLAPVI